MNKKTNILFISTLNAPFIQDDLELLEKYFIVKKRIDHGIRQIVKIAFGVLTSDMVFCWFASVYASIAVLIGKILGLKSIVVAGGVDIAKVEKLGYGIWLNPWKSKLVRYALRNADRVLVSDFTMKTDAIRLASYDGHNIVYVPPAFDTEFWRPLGEKEPEVLTVAVVDDHRTMLRKGIDILIEAARKLQHISFVVVGVNKQLILHLELPPNITFHGHIPRNDLLPIYRRAKIYCQPSVHEALGYALREAMLCGCIPVVSDVGGMPTAAAGIGLLVPPSDVEVLAAALQDAIKMGNEVGMKARARIVALYSKEKREQEILRVIKGLLH